MPKVMIRKRDYFILESILFVFLIFFYLLGGYFNISYQNSTQTMLFIIGGLLFLVLVKLGYVMKKQEESW